MRTETSNQLKHDEHVENPWRRKARLATLKGGGQTHLSSFLRNKASAGLRLTNNEYHVVE